MKEFIKQQYLNVLAATAIVTAAIGLTINNIFLAKYGISDFNIFQSREIFTGIIFLAYLGVLGTIWFVFIDLKDISRNKFRLLAANTIYKPILLTSATMLALSTDRTIPTLVLPFWSIEFPTEFLRVGGLLSFLGFSILFSNAQGFVINEKPDSKKAVSIENTFAYASLVSGLLMTLNLAVYDEPTRSVLFFNAFVSFSIGGFFVVQVGGKIDSDRGIRVRFSSAFSQNPEDRWHWMDLVSAIVMSSITIIFIVYYYATSIYPGIPEILGGPKSAVTSYTLESNKVEVGVVIHKTEKKVFLLQKDVIRILDIDKVVSFKASK